GALSADRVGERRARLLRGVRRHRAAVEGALPSAEPDQPAADADHAARRDARRPDPDLRLHQHDRRRVRSMTAVEPGSASANLTRKEVWKLLGEPTDQIGSVNDPRTHDEHGVRWNEKWIYRHGDRVVRIVLWNRYDRVGVFAVGPDGALKPELLPSCTTERRPVRGRSDSSASC